jgi:hypothetical protein
MAQVNPIAFFCPPIRFDMFGPVYDVNCMTAVTVAPLGIALAVMFLLLAFAVWDLWRL